ncbi:fimbrial biogenesis chaperone [Enterobacter asburiae]|uniref:fimbrial biogenesis chaperone n=1 Tax=Enterobacter asburiae TaxID=61645 RepID=UPI0021D033FA|nr:molecular chaperone [Enterobacter asburiae]
MAALFTAGVTVGASCAEAAGISLGGTRLIFDGAGDVASISVTNSSDEDVWLMRFWVSPYGDDKSQGDEGKNTTPFIVTPPLYRLDPQSAVQLRVNRMGNTLPADRESVFYLNSLAIPPKKGEKGYEKAVQNGLQFAVNTRIKLIYRPGALNDKAVIKALPGKLTVSGDGKNLTVKNPTPYYITLVQLAVNGKVLQTDKDTMVAPFGTLSLPSGDVHGRLSYQTVDDNGARTPVTDEKF